MTVQLLASYTLICLLSAATPGPGTLAVLAQSATSGFKKTIPLILGIQLGLLFVALAAISGIAVLLKSSLILYLAIKYMGLAYLMYLGVASLKAAYQNASLAGSSGNSYSLKQGAIITCLSPKTLLFFASFFPVFIDEKSPYAVQAMVLIMVLLFVTLAVHIVYSLLMEKISPLVHKHYRLFNILVGLSFLILAPMLAMN